MTTVASLLSIASGFALMGYHEPPANLIATSIIINLALTPLTAIVIVTTAESSRIAQAREFVGALEAAGLRVSAMVVNRVLADLPDAAELTSARIAPALKKKLKRNLADYAALKTREESSLSALRALHLATWQ